MVLKTCLPPHSPSLPPGLAPKVVMLADGWEQGDAFVAAVKSELALRPLPAPYYPGLRQRYEAFKQAYPQVSVMRRRRQRRRSWESSERSSCRPSPPGDLPQMIAARFMALAHCAAHPHRPSSAALVFCPPG